MLNCGTSRSERMAMPSLRLLEIVGINALDGVADDIRHANIVLNHKIRELVTVNQYDALLDVADVFSCLPRELRGRDQDTFPSTLTFEAANECLNHWPTDGSIPALGLNVDLV